MNNKPWIDRELEIDEHNRKALEIPKADCQGEIPRYLPGQYIQQIGRHDRKASNVQILDWTSPAFADRWRNPPNEPWRAGSYPYQAWAAANGVSYGDTLNYIHMFHLNDFSEIWRNAHYKRAAEFFRAKENEQLLASLLRVYSAVQDDIRRSAIAAVEKELAEKDALNRAWPEFLHTIPDDDEHRDDRHSTNYRIGGIGPAIVATTAILACVIVGAIFMSVVIKVGRLYNFW